jgi:hypothetical protein
MAAFLSDEWVEELALACAGAPPRSGSDTGQSDGGRFVLEPVVTGVPERGEVRYRIAFEAGMCAVEAPSEFGDHADVQLETDYVTAVALSRGTANAQAALADGRLRVSGEVARLAEHAATLSALDDLFGALRSATTYPAP